MEKFSSINLKLLLKKETLIPVVVSSLSTALVFFAWQSFTQKKKIKKLKSDLNLQTNSLSLRDHHFDETTLLEETEHQLAKKNNQFLKDDPDLKEHLTREQLARNYAFLGEEGMKNIRKSFVIVVGLGGVGGHAAHLLLRSGVEHLRIIDFDQVSLSSLNRHAVATQADVGTSKSICLKKHFSEIMPHAKVDAVVDLFTIENAEKLLQGKPDYVLDCIDNLNTKIDLIKYCVDNKIKVISSMGSGAKADPSRIQLGDISDTSECPLAKATRRGLRRVGIDHGVTVVFSLEKPHSVSLLPLEEEKVEEANEFSALPNFRSRILPVLGTIPAIFGCSMASFAAKLRDGLYERLHRDLFQKEKDHFKDTRKLKLNKCDVGFIFEEIWRGRSAVSGDMDKLCIVRWNKNLQADYGNVICLTRKEAIKHFELDFEDIEHYYDKKVLNYINDRFKLEEFWNKSRFA
ncbi:hypothetical protein HK099_000269 [Clydaea vesicula]|uniref:THIF-type NAD/FAD binding fold domain-containing protein n=1 Tax=Clydaea vesicula TaxID=447962 RepID=A0AAD5TUW3_9FUNG|nr:hypothetical protein HK099_000269 [Clydaea vesicula]